MLDQELWSFINSFAPWLSAVGTIAAVITSLYLARKDARINLKVSAGVRMLFVEGKGPGGGSRFVSLDVTNAGRRVATINSLYWKIGILRRQTYWWITPRNLFSSPTPVQLGDGDSASFKLPISEFEENLQPEVKDALSGPTSWLKARFICAGVWTSTGEEFEARVEKSLRDLFLQMASGTPSHPTEQA